MKLLATRRQSYKLDEQASAYGLSAETLMDTAGLKASEWLLNQFSSGSFHIFCGPGHNGGDGWAVAYYLKKAGREVEVFSCESSNRLFNKKKEKAQSLNLKIRSLSEWRAQRGSVLIDALFGVGLGRPLDGEFRELVLKINKASLPVVALDLPSGLCADTGLVLGSAVKADYTLSFALSKPGFYLNEGASYSGTIFVFPIGFPQELLNKVCNSVYLVQKKEVMTFLPSYKDSANKTDRGWALISAGRKGMWGCGFLACRAAYTVGSGYVTWAGQNYPYEKSLEIPEALLSLLDEERLFDKKTAVGAGPGLGFSKEVKNFILKLKDRDLPIVLDADALTLLAKTDFTLNKNVLLTPHAGELSRLIDVPSKTIDEDRLLYAKQGANKYNSWLLLKGFYPVLSDGDKTYIIPSGNSALGKAGSGDVLTGMITGLMAQGLSVFQAGVLGTFLQGETADRWIEKGKDINSFSASEIIKELPFVMSDFRLNCDKSSQKKNGRLNPGQYKMTIKRGGV